MNARFTRSGSSTALGQQLLARHSWLSSPGRAWGGTILTQPQCRGKALHGQVLVLNGGMDACTAIEVKPNVPALLFAYRVIHVCPLVLCPLIP
jgi:hypothetical protein